MTDPVPRDKNGRLVKIACDDRNCSGKLVYDPATSKRLFQHVWNCDGLTHDDDGGELEACGRTVFGPTRARAFV